MKLSLKRRAYQYEQLSWLVGGDGGRKRGNASSSLVTSENMYVQVVSFCLLKLEH